MKRAPLLLCLDLGTSACKGALIDPAGRIVAEYREGYELLYGGDSMEAEQDPQTLWSAACRCVRGLLSEPARAEAVAAMSLSAQMSTHMLVTAESAPLTRFVSWADRRAERESGEMAATFSREELACELGATLPVAPSWALPKLKWWRAHRPELLDAARYMIQPKDWIIWKLCGVWVSDLSSLRGLVDQKSGRVSPVLAKWAGFDPALVPPIAAPESVAGMIQEPLARAWGLPTATPVFVGWNDLAAAVIGCTGLPDRPVGFDITGTSEHLGVCLPLAQAPKSAASLSEIPLGDAHRLRYGVTSSSGRIVQWYWEQFRSEKGGEVYSQLEKEAAAITGGADGLIFLPCLDGERAPWFNPRTRGGFYDLALAHREAHFSRAVLEGITFTLRSIQLRLGLETAPEEFHVLGGGSAMATWNPMKADILQANVVTMECAEAGCLGAAITAAKGLGWHASWAEAGRAFIRPAQIFKPDPALRGRYEKQHARFEKIFRAMEPLFDDRSNSGEN